MKKQMILGLIVMISLLVLVSSAQAAINVTIVNPTIDEEISGEYTLNATTGVECSNVSFSWSTDNATRYLIGSNDTNGTVFTFAWNTTPFCTGSYTLNATTNWSAADVAYMNFTINNNVITLNTPAASETISSGNYTFNATTNTARDYVNFSWSNDSGATWTKFAYNNTKGTVFTAVWDTTNLTDGTYDFNATTNCSVDETRETGESLNVVIDNVADVTVDSPEFSTIMIAGLIGLLSATAILLRKKKE